ncbi:hypothetical protein TIFTF001_028914 [Ficus carica]|uniref:Pentatricopeptide repeat-containing protein n=1 Tax=Ficus carica TaxID=3494 RepID=A0AA88DQW1_FICCA|nr:hypothetical protein TIFTF001_028914 [Ficus carica]
MTTKGVVPDVVTYSSLIAGLCKVGKTWPAQDLLHKMQVIGQPPDAQTYAILFDGFCKNGELEEAMTLFCDMEEKKLPLSIVIYTTLLEECVKLEILQRQKISFANYHPKFKGEMVAKGFYGDVSTYELFLDLVS